MRRIVALAWSSSSITTNDPCRVRGAPFGALAKTDVKAPPNRREFFRRPPGGILSGLRRDKPVGIADQ
jgi:hypothetical protein